jgi:hypothetical protein
VVVEQEIMEVVVVEQVVIELLFQVDHLYQFQFKLIQ